MTKRVEYFYDYVSAASFFSHFILPKIVGHAGAELVYRPMFLGGVMQATGNRPPATVIPKGIWMSQDLGRWAKKYGLTFNSNPHFPVNTLAVMRGACALLDDPVFPAYDDAMTYAVWRDAKNMGDPEEIAKVVSEIGIDPAAFAEMVKNQKWKDALKANTDEAVERGVFGAPAMFVGDDLYFGQDRLFMVAEALGIDIRDVVPGY